MPEIEGRTNLTIDQAATVSELRDAEGRCNGMLDEFLVAPGVDQRLRAMAASHFEIAWMLLTKAVVNPERLSTSPGEPT